MVEVHILPKSVQVSVFTRVSEAPYIEICGVASVTSTQRKDPRTVIFSNEINLHFLSVYICEMKTYSCKKHISWTKTEGCKTTCISFKISKCIFEKSLC